MGQGACTLRVFRRGPLLFWLHHLRRGETEKGRIAALVLAPGHIEHAMAHQTERTLPGSPWLKTPIVILYSC